MFIEYRSLLLTDFFADLLADKYPTDTLAATTSALFHFLGNTQKFYTQLAMLLLTEVSYCGFEGRGAAFLSCGHPTLHICQEINFNIVL